MSQETAVKQKLHEILSEDNWCQGKLRKWENGKWKSCIMDWLDKLDNWDATFRLKETLQLRGWTTITQFNDSSLTKVQDVINICKELNI